MLSILRNKLEQIKKLNITTNLKSNYNIKTLLFKLRKILAQCRSINKNKVLESLKEKFNSTLVTAQCTILLIYNNIESTLLELIKSRTDSILIIPILIKYRQALYTYLYL